MISGVKERSRDSRPLDRVLGWAEDLVYIGIAVMLFISAVVLLLVAGDQLLDVFDDLKSDPIVEVLDTLLLVFIVVELLSAVRRTLRERELIAEPFLIVGIIASIKEIVVLSVKAAESIDEGESFRNQLWEIGVLGAVVVLLGGTAWLLRLKEREPDEGARSA
jgi:uncharacterized membrane protein (DUF373 family)